jgi:predicted PurR-regulated permease PerM
MQAAEENGPRLSSKELMDVLIRVGVLAVLVVWISQVIAPFLSLLLWALILAVTLYPLQQKLAKHLGERQGRAASLLVLVGLLLIGVPTVMLGSSFAGQIHDLHGAFSEGKVSIDPPAPSVAEWPLVGEKVYEAWNQAATDMPAFMEELQPQLGNFSTFILKQAASTAGAVALFLVSLLVAGIMMAYGRSGSEAMLRILRRLTGEIKGPKIHALATATTRSVATGVLGVALIQSILLGLGFLWAGVPGAGVLAIVALVLGIAQVPMPILTLPVIGYIWWAGDTSLGLILVTIYLVLATLVDNVLKPILLGRGVDAPMPVILLGAIGGMVAAGIIGLFIGAVVLAVGYQIFMAWVDEVELPSPGAPEGKVSEAEAD